MYLQNRKQIIRLLTNKYMKFWFTILFISALPVALLSQVQNLFLDGRAEMKKEHYNEAIGIFTSGSSSDNVTADLLLNLGQCFYQVNDYNSAIHYLLLADNMKKNLGSYWLAKSYAMAGKNDSAIIYLKANLSSAYKLPESTIKLDPAFNDLENTRLWKDLWSQEWYDDFENLLAEINYLTRKNEYVEILDLIDQNLVKYEHKHQIYAARGKVFLDLKNFNSAVTAYSRAIEISGTHPEYYINRAKAYSNLQKYDLAVSDLIKALNLEPDNFPLYVERGRLYNSFSKFDMALDDISYYMTFFPEDIQAMYLNGQIYYDQGSYLKALEWFNKCLSIDQSEANFYIARGNTYLRTNTYKFALQDYGMALDLDPKNPDTYLSKGLARYQLNDAEGACNDWQKAARLGSAKAIEMLNTRCQNLKKNGRL
jgi:tetratricopeptide (TPR) repeat protein